MENKISKHTLFKKCLYWHRYVDDILVCFTGTDRQLSIFLDFINNIHKNIQFTLEVETNNSINFLDLKITREENKHKFAIFHKPSHTDITIHNTSLHPHPQKLAAYHSMIHRLVNVPMSKEDFEKELNIIKQIAINNGYSPNTIDSILKKKTHKKALSLIYPTNTKTKKNFKTLTYLGLASDRVSSVLKKENINIAFKTNNTIGKFLKNNKDKTDKTKKCGVYKLDCGSCPNSYVGQTGRTFGKRIKEHKRDFQYKKHNSAYSSHLIENNHNFNDNFSVLHIENKSKKLSLLESLEINKLKKSGNILNDQLETNNSPLLNLF